MFSFVILQTVNPALVNNRAITVFVPEEIELEAIPDQWYTNLPENSAGDKSFQNFRQLCNCNIDVRNYSETWRGTSGDAEYSERPIRGGSLSSVYYEIPNTPEVRRTILNGYGGGPGTTQAVSNSEYYIPLSGGPGNGITFVSVSNDSESYWEVTRTYDDPGDIAF